MNRVTVQPMTDFQSCVAHEHLDSYKSEINRVYNFQVRPRYKSNLLSSYRNIN